MTRSNWSLRLSMYSGLIFNHPPFNSKHRLQIDYPPSNNSRSSAIHPDLQVPNNYTSNQNKNRLDVRTVWYIACNNTTQVVKTVHECTSQATVFLLSGRYIDPGCFTIRPSSRLSIASLMTSSLYTPTATWSMTHTGSISSLSALLFPLSKVQKIFFWFKDFEGNTYYNLPN